MECRSYGHQPGCPERVEPPEWDDADDIDRSQLIAEMEINAVRALCVELGRELDKARAALKAASER